MVCIKIESTANNVLQRTHAMISISILSMIMHLCIPISCKHKLYIYAKIKPKNEPLQTLVC